MYSKKELGDAFEIFCLQVLEREKQLFCIDRVWLWKDFPYKDQIQWVEEKDTGFDLAAILVTGEYFFIQAKYKSSGSLTWGKVATTEALARRIGCDFLIMTNTNEISSRLLKSGIRLVCGKDPILGWVGVDHMFTEVEKGRKKTKISIPLKPRDYQVEIIEKIKSMEKSLLYLPCGLGKTFIASEAMEGNTLIFAPTLYLLDNIGRTFLKKRFDRVLMIGSDFRLGSEGTDREGKNAEGENPSLIEPTIFHRTTDLLEIKNFLGQKGKKLVLCTYASYGLAQKAFIDKAKNWSIFYDECHRITFEDPIEGRKTLFASASPTIDQLENIPLIDSYTFEDGVRDGHLARFDIYLSMVGNMTGYLKNPTIRLFFEGFDQEEKLYTLGIGLSIVKAVLDLSEENDRNCRKVLVYCNSNKRSLLLKKLVVKLFEVFDTEIPCFYTDSSKTINSRHQTIQNFLAQKRALLFSCRIFSEGVDVPLVDSVIFAESRKSFRDVVQSVGRCLRVCEEKSFGGMFRVEGDSGDGIVEQTGLICKSWVILPCVVSEREFDITKNIIRSLGRMDLDLKEGLRQKARVSIGGKKERIPSGIKEKVIEWGKGELLKMYDSVTKEIISGYSTSERASEEFYEMVEESGYKLLGEYINNRTKVPLECPRGHKIEMAPNGFKSGNRCRFCSGKDSRTAKDSFIKLVEDSGYKLLGEYIGSGTKVSLECPKGHKIEMTPNTFKSGKRCRICSGKDPKTAGDSFVKLVEDSGYKLLREYIQSGTRVPLECPKGHKIEMTPKDFKRGNRCRFCSGRDSKTAGDSFVKLVEESGYKLLREYIGNKTKVPLECPKGHKIEMVPYSFKSGSRCRFCRAPRSPEEIKKQFLQTVEKRFDLIGQYKEAGTKVSLKCISSGHVFDAIPRTFHPYKKCLKCKA